MPSEDAGENSTGGYANEYIRELAPPAHAGLRQVPSCVNAGYGVVWEGASEASPAAVQIPVPEPGARRSAAGTLRLLASQPGLLQHFAHPLQDLSAAERFLQELHVFLQHSVMRDDV